MLVISSPLIWNVLLEPFQRQRIATLFNPESDPFGAGWNIIQSKIAILVQVVFLASASDKALILS